MYDTLGTALGGATGGVLGHMGSVLSAPRRALWSALGMPDSGSELLAQTFGMDPESSLTHALGFGAEMVLDPLTYAGMLTGGPLGKIYGHAVGAEGRLGSEIASTAAARRAAQEGLVARSAAEEATLAAQKSRIPELAMQDIPGIAGAQTKTYAQATADAHDALEKAGLAYSGPGNETILHGRMAPPGFGPTPYRDPATNRMAGRALSMDPAQARLPVVPITAEERDLMRSGDARPRWSAESRRQSTRVSRV